MAHWCRICRSHKPNEKFTGKGHKNHICKICAKKPQDEIEIIDQMQEITDFLSQSNISRKNIKRLQQLSGSSTEDVKKIADIVLAVAKVKPHKKRRLKFLAKGHRDLLLKLEETGLIYAHKYG